MQLTNGSKPAATIKVLEGGQMTVAIVGAMRILTTRRLNMPRLGFWMLMAVAAASPALGQESFNSVAGSWSGSGWMKPKDGPRERVRCKVDYVPKNEGQSVRMNVRCASEAYKMDLGATIEQSGSELSGNWFESQYRVGGKVYGKNQNGVIDARIEGDKITALLVVRTKGSRQSFVMESPGAWVSEVAIDLTRDAR
ncbi:hypothetical protein [Bradyrhizobium sp. USDA 336]|uniref:hypothetical protein n=1 Tax=Bradyrhizobium sp. USDA 336 TaxID=3156311 RepID=UPI003833F97D